MANTIKQISIAFINYKSLVIDIICNSLVASGSDNCSVRKVLKADYLNYQH